MADRNNNSSGGNTGLAFILGAVVVALGVLAWVVFSGGENPLDEPEIQIDLPGGGSIEGEVEGGG